MSAEVAIVTAAIDSGTRSAEIVVAAMNSMTHLALRGHSVVASWLAVTSMAVYSSVAVADLDYCNPGLTEFRPDTGSESGTSTCCGLYWQTS